jgi:hypothetical protein
MHGEVLRRVRLPMARTELEHGRPATPSVDAEARTRPGWPSSLQHLAYGADYNPEQWSEEVWREDARRVEEAGVEQGGGGVVYVGF